jgi:hypothetical protein
MASDFSDRLTFVPVNVTLCVEIRTCVADRLNAIQGGDAYKYDQFEAYDFCNTDDDSIPTEADLLAKKAELCGEGSSGGVTYVVPSGDGGCRTLPVCPDILKPYFADFSPAYPLEEDPYLAAVTSIKGTGLAIENGFGKLCYALRCLTYREDSSRHSRLLFVNHARTTRSNFSLISRAYIYIYIHSKQTIEQQVITTLSL